MHPRMSHSSAPGQLSTLTQTTPRLIWLSMQMSRAMVGLSSRREPSTSDEELRKYLRAADIKVSCRSPILPDQTAKRPQLTPVPSCISARAAVQTHSSRISTRTNSIPTERVRKAHEPRNNWGHRMIIWLPRQEDRSSTIIRIKLWQTSWRSRPRWLTISKTFTTVKTRVKRREQLTARKTP